MDKFDDYLKKRSTKEIEEFTLPESFENKIEETLVNLDKIDQKESKVWYKEKKFLSSAACLAIICLAGFGMSKVSNFNEGISKMNLSENQRTTYDSSEPEIASNESRESDSPVEFQNEFNVNQYGVSDIINLEDINSIVFKEVQKGGKYKVVNNKEDVKSIVDIINSITLKTVSSQSLEQWDFLIQTNGASNHSIIVQDNIMNVDDKYYEITSEGVDELLKIYNQLNYGESDIPFCDF